MRNKYKNIAVAIDFSEQSKKAFLRAIEFAKSSDATIHLVHVIDTKSFGSIAAYDLKYAEQLKEEAMEEMVKLKREVEATGIEQVEIRIDEGLPKDILTTMSGVDLIICGATGLNRLEKMMLGSVAERVVRSASCDVLMVR